MSRKGVEPRGRGQRCRLLTKVGEGRPTQEGRPSDPEESV